ncbi:hypothetical protein GIB67_033382 [Kingdonia uniflora]|uniref:PHD-type domain-containing protein n=1 Tax=Kingdonia uniflora TaxID=39325 RepID=A0A7J7LTQ2_9MAGN|nr:hypothetical protein GIB67_033382 [Kingdonia uniflora]
MASATTTLRRRRAQAPNPHNLLHCEECRSEATPAELLLCDRCDRGFHLFCLKPILVSLPKEDSWFCPFCSNRKKSKRPKSLVMSKKKRKLLPFIPSEDNDRRLKQMAFLATALTAKGAVVSNELTYAPGMASRSVNRASLEQGGMQVSNIIPADGISCATKASGGLHGDVDYLKNQKHDSGDSMMTLISATNPSESLVICPERCGNIAHFISGINNHTLCGAAYILL